MKIHAADYWLARASQWARGPLALLGDLESQWMRRELDMINIERPIILGGLARAGSTMLLELLSQVPGVATHRYRDFPFVAVPTIWNRWLDATARESSPIDRPHQDRIQITQQSPEGMEEVLWNLYGPTETASNRTASNRTSATGPALTPWFRTFYRQHLQKMLWLRSGTRYCSKNNNVLSRLSCLDEILPDCELVIPIRHPVAHCRSLARQHRLFTKYAADNSRVPAMLAAAGHYEFGPQRKPLGFSQDTRQQVRDYWLAGHDELGYAVEWSEVYGRVSQLLQDECYRQRVQVVKYEDFCDAPVQRWAVLCERLGLDGSAVGLQHIVMEPPRKSDDSVVDESVWLETQQVAERFGY